MARLSGTYPPRAQNRTPHSAPRARVFRGAPWATWTLVWAMLLGLAMGPGAGLRSDGALGVFGGAPVHASVHTEEFENTRFSLVTGIAFETEELWYWACSKLMGQSCAVCPEEGPCLPVSEVLFDFAALGRAEWLRAYCDELDPEDPAYVQACEIAEKPAGSYCPDEDFAFAGAAMVSGGGVQMSSVQQGIGPMIGMSVPVIPGRSPSGSGGEDSGQTLRESVPMPERRPGFGGGQDGGVMPSGDPDPSPLPIPLPGAALLALLGLGYLGLARWRQGGRA